MLHVVIRLIDFFASSCSGVEEPRPDKVIGSSLHGESAASSVAKRSGFPERVLSPEVPISG